MKVLRSTFVAAAAIFAAACGDKVNIIQPTNSTTPVVNSVTVAPSTAVMSVGQTTSFSAIVDVSNGAATTVTWSSSDASKVSVSATGVASAVAATPGVAICATSTADAGKKGCASVVVNATGGGGNTPASISIASITGAGGLNVPVPVPPGSVGTATATGGQLDVRMNLVSNSLIAERVDVLVDGVVAASQTFTAAQLAAIAAQTVAAELEPNTQTGVATVVISIAINNCKTGTGATLNLQVVCGTASTTPSWLNGTHTISARVVGHFSGAANGSTTTNAGQGIQLLFANASGFIGTVTVNGINTTITTAATSVVDAAGFKWVAGAVTVKGVPVIYTGQTVQFATFAFGGLGCSAGGTRTLANIAPSTDGSFTATFSGTSTTATGNVSAYEFNPALAGCTVLLNAGEAPTVAAVGSDNDAIVLAAGGANGGAGFLNALVNLNADPALALRLDNAAPTRGTCLLNATTAPGTSGGTAPAAYPDAAILVGNSIGGNIKAQNALGTIIALVQPVRTRGWINGTTVNTGIFAGTDRIVTACPDLGSGRLGSTTNTNELSVEIRAGLVTDANATVDATAPVANFAGMAETATPTAYRARIRVKDKIGNAQTSFSVTNVPNDGNVNSVITGLSIHAPLTGLAAAVGNGIDATMAQTANSTTPGVFPANIAAFEFGVDLTPPVLTIGNTAQITVAGGGGRFAAFPGAQTLYIAQDNPNAATPAIPASGFFNLGGAPLWTSINRRDVVNGNLFVCDNLGVTAAVYLSASSTACGSWVVGTQNIGRVAGGIGLLNQAQDLIAPLAVDAYFTQLSQIVDQAGNQSASITNTVVIDASAPAIGGVSYPPFLVGGGSVIFQSTTIDNLDIQLERLNLQYGAGGAGLAGALIDGATGAAWAGFTTAAGGSTFWQQDVTVNAFTGLTSPATLIPNHAMAFPVTGLIATWEVNNAAVLPAVGPPSGALTAAAVGDLQIANGQVVNQANTAAASATPVIPGSLPRNQLPAGTVPGSLPLDATGAANHGPGNWYICNVAAVCPSVPVNPAGANVNVSRDGATAATATTVTINAVATGLTGVFTNPFAAVAFYVYNPNSVACAAAGATEGWRLIGTVANAAAVTDNGGAGVVGAGRNWTFSFTWDPNAVTAPCALGAGVAYRIMAVGVGSAATVGQPVLPAPGGLGAGAAGTALATPLASITATIVP